MTSDDRYAHISAIVHDDLVRDVLTTLNHSQLTIDQQRLLCTVMDIAVSLREEARGAMPNRLVQDSVDRRAAPAHLVYSLRSRPLNEAAIRQNVRARAHRLYMARIAADGLRFVQTPSTIERPIRYNDAYDDLLGTRSFEDGSARALAEMYGDHEANLERFNSDTHNGLKFGRDHLHITVENRNLIEARQARALANLPTEEIDQEVVCRVLIKPTD